MKLIYTNENQFLVGNAKNIVENSGMATVLKNEYAAGGTGELSPMDTWPELWIVNDADYEGAVKLIESALGSEHTKEWICSNCNEINDAAFEFCWKCQSENL